MIAGVISYVLFRVVPSDQPVDCRLQWHRHDPLAVTLRAGIGARGCVDWLFARDLLADGVDGRAGDGDVRVERCGTQLLLTLDNPAQGVACQMRTDADIVASVLDETYRQVPRGLETVDVDAWLARLTAGDQR